jgi:hypothetical protein
MKEIISRKHPKYNLVVCNNGDVFNQKGKLLSGGNGRYKRVSARDSENNLKHLLVHRLVVEVFIGEIEEGMVVNHVDGNKLNNNADNLEICTPKENVHHAMRTGLMKPVVGEDAGGALLKESEVVKIYQLIKDGLTNQQIADMFGINFRTVSLIRPGTRWKHLFHKHFDKPLQSKSTDKDLAFCFEVIEKLPYMTNIGISVMYNLEPSLVSRVRSKQTWIKIWEMYNSCATTIPQGSTPQAIGGGNAESLTT